MRRTVTRWTTGVSLMVGTAVARACTVCDSATGHAVRGRIFDGHFLRMGAMLLAPFPVFVLAAAWLYVYLPVGDEDGTRCCE